MSVWEIFLLIWRAVMAVLVLLLCAAEIWRWRLRKLGLLKVDENHHSCSGSCKYRKYWPLTPSTTWLCDYYGTELTSSMIWTNTLRCRACVMGIRRFQVPKGGQCDDRDMAATYIDKSFQSYAGPLKVDPVGDATCENCTIHAYEHDILGCPVTCVNYRNNSKYPKTGKPEAGEGKE